MNPYENKERELMTEEQVGERRGSDRLSLEGSVCIKVIEQKILGPSRNISTEGIYFIAEAEMPVEVTLPENGGVVTGKIVRVGAVRDGEIGIAIRFDEQVSADRLPHGG
ncbi:MAG: PilZ domain-containing protein [Planctomycetota bacterium]|nr:PilZ domain-containing protein [Planctomycetota bacterium]